MTAHKRVLLVIESSRSYGRGCLRGIASYVRAHGSWRIVHIERSLTELLPKNIKRWQGDGVISRIETVEVADAVRSLRLPTVDLRGLYRMPSGAMLDTDPEAVARLACDHFVERGLRQLAYCGFAGLAFSDQRQRAFVAAAQRQDITTSVYAGQDKSTQERVGTIEHERHGETHLDELVPWLQELPKPIGVMACNDTRGRHIVSACDLAGIRVPEEILVIGVDDDEVICELSNPTLSSVAPDTHRLGHDGARMLDQMLAGKSPPPSTVLIPPVGIVVRRSSDAFAVDDKQLVEALHFIRENACKGINVRDVVRVCAMSRSTLERRFAEKLGHSPREQIMRERFRHVKYLLSETDYQLAHVARLTGFQTTAHLIASFKQRTGTTPMRYRSERTGA